MAKLSVELHNSMKVQSHLSEKIVANLSRVSCTVSTEGFPSAVLFARKVGFQKMVSVLTSRRRRLYREVIGYLKMNVELAKLCDTSQMCPGTCLLSLVRCVGL